MRRFSASVFWVLLLVCALPGSAWALQWNDGPGAVSGSTPEGNGSSVGIIGLVANDGYNRQITLQMDTFPATGSATFSGVGFFSAGAIVNYAPPADFTGTISFRVRASVPQYNVFTPAESITKIVNVTVTPVNDAPSFTLTASHTVNEDGGAQSVAAFAGGFNPGGSGFESAQTVIAYLVTATDPDYFSVPPAIAINGTLTYTPAPNRAGSTTISVQVRDSGGTANPGDVNTSLPLTSTININAISDGRLYATPAGGGNGSSWASPFTLRQAMAYSTSGEEIWVQQGVHTPGHVLTALRTSSFLLRTGVSVYGGFAGSETALGQRNVKANTTILSGDIGAAGSNADNSYHVVNAVGNGTLDGFTIRDGNANGGGSDQYGGGLIAYLAGVPTVRRCIFTANASAYGGGTLTYGGVGATFSDCVFSANSATYGGGAYFQNAALSNCVFYGNSATFEGSAIYAYVGVTMATSTVAGNSAPAGSGAVYASAGNLTVDASILWGNSPISLKNGSGTSAVSSSIVQGGLPPGFTGSASSADPLFVNSGDPDGADNIWMTGDDGLFPQALSPARDAIGSSSVTADIRGVARPGGPSFDMGAYERRVLYASAGTAGAGSSWAAPGELRTLLAGAVASDEVWVKAGTYKPTTGTNRTISFPLAAGVGLYGGFVGNETAREARDWTANRVILSGDIGAAGNASDNTHTVVMPGGVGTILDGFIVRGGNANLGGNGLHDGGGAMYLVNAASTVRNCVFDGNLANYAGGAIFCQANGQVRVENCLFTGNAARYGGAIEAEYGGGSVNVFNSTFVGNSASVHGDAIETAAISTPSTITNCVMWANGSREDIYFADGASACTISYSLVQGSGGSGAWVGGNSGTNGGGNVDADPQFFAAGDADGIDNLYLTADDGFLLLTGSPAANSGQLASAPPKDIRRKSRPLGGGVEMGCYEGLLGRAAFASGTSSFGESAGPVQVAVNLAGAADEPITVNWAITGGTAANGAAVGAGSGNWDFPLYTYYHDARTSSIYLASELGPDAIFSSLTLDVTGLPSMQMSNFTVRIKQVAQTDFSTPDWGDGTGWTTVYQDDLTVSATGPLTLRFGSGSGPDDDGNDLFAYDDAANLMVDISFNNFYWLSHAGTVRVTNTSAPRSIFYNTDSGNGDPLQWVGPGNVYPSPPPMAYNAIPNIVFSSEAGGERADYVAATGGMLTFAPGETAKSIALTIISDLNDEPNETVTFALSSPVGGLLGTTTAHTLTIVDDDLPPTVQFAAAGSSGSEASSAPSVGVTLSAQSDRVVSIDYARANGANGGTADITASGASDGQMQTGNLLFPRGTVSASIPASTRIFSVTDDNRDENDESLGIALSAPVNATVGATALHTYTVTDNDTSALNISAATVGVTEGNPTPATFTVALATRPHDPGGLVRLDFLCSDSGEAQVSANGTAWGSTASIWLSDSGTGNGLTIGSPASWNSPRTISVRSVDDTAEPIDDGDVSSILTIEVNGIDTTDSRYAALPSRSVDIITSDNDIPQIIVEPWQAVPSTGVPPLPMIEQYSIRYSAAVDGTGYVVTVHDANNTGVPDISGIVPGMALYSDSDGLTTTVQAIGPGANQITLDAPVSAASYLYVGYFNQFRVRLTTKPSAAVDVSFVVDDPSLASLGQIAATINPVDWQNGALIPVYPGDDAIDQDADGNQTNDYRDTLIIVQNNGSGDPSYQGIDPDDMGIRIYDEEVRGAAFTQGSVDLVEGGAATTYGIRLTSQPSGTVTVTPAVSGPQASVSGVATFTAANWYSFQYVTVAPLDDQDYDPSATATITHAIGGTGTDYAGATAGTVGITFSGDNDSTIPVVDPVSGLFTGEDGTTASFTVRLTTRPAVGEVVTIPFTTSDDQEGTFFAGAISWNVYIGRTATGAGDGSSPANVAAWTTPVTVFLEGVDDAGGADGDVPYVIEGGFTVSSLGTGPFHNIDTQDVDVINRDDEQAGIKLVGSPLTITEGLAPGQYQLQLQWLVGDPPTGFNVVEVELSSASADVTFSPSTVVWYGLSTDPTFTASKVITVTAVDDVIDEPLETGIAISHEITESTDATRFPVGLQIPDARVNVADNDVPGIEVSPASLTTSEGGSAGSVSVRLKTRPVGTVTIGLSLAGDTDEVVLGGPSVAFDATDWATPKVVTVTPVNDAIDDGDRAYTVVTAAAVVTNATADAGYNGLGSADVQGTNVDNDAVGIAISETSLTLAEGGVAGAGNITDTYTIQLLSEPTGTVTLALDGSGQMSFDIGSGPQASVFFAATAGAGDGSGRNLANPRAWNSALTVTVTALVDQIDEATPHQASILHTISGADYVGIPVAPITASITDAPDAAFQVGLSVTGGTIIVAEGALSSTRNVRLLSRPTSNVTVAIASSDATVATSTVASLVFTAANWNTNQTFRISGVEDQIDQDVDGNQANDARSAAITLTVDSTDAAYDGLAAVARAVSVTDNDQADVVVAPLALQVNEAGSTAAFTVSLAKQPRGTVTMPLSVTDAQRGGISASELTFTPSNWSTPQAVTVTGRDQDLSNDAADGSTIFQVQTGDPDSPPSAGDHAYHILTAANVPDVTVSILPSNAPPRIANHGNLTIAEDAVTAVSLSGVNSGQLGELQMLTFSAVSSNPGLISDPQAAKLVLTGAATDADLSRQMILTPALNASGSAIITVEITDDDTILSDAPLTTTLQFTVTVSPVNDAPMVALSTAIPVHTEGGSATPVLGSLQLTDVDSTAISSAKVRITNAVDGSVEILQADGAGTAIIPAYDAATQTLTLTAPVPQPLADFQAVLRTVAYRTASNQPTISPVRLIQVIAHDGVDQSVAVSAQVSIARSNDPPVLSGSVDPLATIAEDLAVGLNGGIQVDDLLSGLVIIGDPDGSLTGLAVTGTGGAVSGIWEFTMDGASSWAPLPDLSGGDNLPLSADGAGQNRLRFRPAANANGTVEISFRAWDGSDGASEGLPVAPVAPGGGTSAFSSATLTANLVITPVNDAPVLAASGVFPSINEDSATHTGASVEGLLAGKLTDIDASALAGLAVTAAGNSDGAWQYSLDGGSVWQPFGAVAPASAVVLAAQGEATRIRFLPAADYHGSAPAISWKAWDRSNGLASGSTGIDATLGGGTRSFSSATRTAIQTVDAVNDAPQLVGLAGSPVIASIAEDVPDAINIGTDVSALIAAINGSDVDTGTLQGIAVTVVDEDSGVWEYSLDGGATWDGFTPVSGADARLLSDAASNRVRFRPGLDFTGSADVVIQLWDGTDGSADGDTSNASISGGTTAFSSNTATLQIVVAPANDPPTIDLNLADGLTRDMTVPAIFVEGSLAQVVTTSGVSVADIDSTTLAGGTIELLDALDGAAERLDVSVSGLTITASWDQSTWTLTLVSGASTTPAEYQQLLTTLTYLNGSETPSGGQRHVRVTLDDGTASASADALLQVQPQNDLPVLRIGGRQNLSLGNTLMISDTGEDLDLDGRLDVDEDANSNLLLDGGEDLDGDGRLDVAEDADSDGRLDRAIIQVSDADNLLTDLVFTVQLRPNLGKLYKDGGSVILNNGDTFTVAELQAGLEYRHDGLLSGVDGFAIKVDDGAGGEAIGIVTLTVAGLVPPQVFINDLTPALWVEDVTPAVRLDAAAGVVDTDSVNFGGGSIIIANPSGRPGDELAFDAALVGNAVVQAGTDLTLGAGGPLIGTISGGLGDNSLVIGLTAGCTPAIAQTILRGVTWINGGNDPGADPDAQETRVLSITINDGSLVSAAVTRTITVDPVDDPPDLLAYTLSLTPGLTVSGQLEASDPEGEPVTFTLGTPLAANGLVTLQSDGSFTYEHQILSGAVDTFSVVVTEDGAGGQSVTNTVQVVVSLPDAAAVRITSAAPVRAEPGVIFTYTPVLAGFGSDLEFILLPGLQEAVAGTAVGFPYTFSGGSSGSGATGTLRINSPVAPPGGYIRGGILVIDRVSGRSAYQPLLIKIAVGVSG